MQHPQYHRLVASLLAVLLSGFSIPSVYANSHTLRALQINHNANARQVLENTLDPGRTTAAVGFEGLEEPFVLSGHTGTVTTVDFFPQGGLITGGQDGTIRIWQTPQGQPVATVQTKGPVASVDVNPAGTYYAVAHQGEAPPALEIYQAGSNTVVQQLSTGASRVLFTPDVRFPNFMAYTTPDRKQIGFWDPSSAFQQIAVTAQGRDTIHDIVFSSSGDMLYFAIAGRIEEVSVPIGQRAIRGILTNVEALSLVSIAVSSDDQLVAAGDMHGGVLVYDKETQKTTYLPELHKGVVRNIAFQRFYEEGSYVLITGDSQEGLHRHILRRTADTVQVAETRSILTGSSTFGTALSQNQTMFAVGLPDNTVRLFSQASFMDHFDYTTIVTNAQRANTFIPMQPIPIPGTDLLVDRALGQAPLGGWIMETLDRGRQWWVLPVFAEGAYRVLVFDVSGQLQEAVTPWVAGETFVLLPEQLAQPTLSELQPGLTVSWDDQTNLGFKLTQAADAPALNVWPMGHHYTGLEDLTSLEQVVDQPTLTQWLRQLAQARGLPFEESTPVFIWLGDSFSEDVAGVFNAVLETHSANHLEQRAILLPFVIPLDATDTKQTDPMATFKRLLPLLAEHAQIQGMHVTSPYKGPLAEAAKSISAIDRSPEVQNLDLASFLRRHDDGRFRTGVLDGQAWVDVSQGDFPGGTLHDKNIVILGSGSSTKAILLALWKPITTGQKPKHLHVIDTERDRVIALQQGFFQRSFRVVPSSIAFDEASSVARLEAADMIIDATTLGKTDDRSPLIDMTRLKPDAAVFSLNWWRTGGFSGEIPLVAAARTQGLTAYNGRATAVQNIARVLTGWMKPDDDGGLLHTVAEQVDSLAPHPGMEEKINWRLAPQYYEQGGVKSLEGRRASILALNQPGIYRINGPRFERLFAPLWGVSVPFAETAPDGDPNGLTGWLADNQLALPRLTDFAQFFRNTVQPHQPDWVVHLNDLPSVRAWNDANPDAPVQLFGYQAYNSAVGSFKIYQYAYEILTEIAGKDLDEPTAEGQARRPVAFMFSTGNGIRAAATVAEIFQKANVLDPNFKIYMVAQGKYLTGKKREALEVLIQSGLLDFMDPETMKDAFREANRKDPRIAPHTGIRVGVDGRPDDGYLDDIDNYLNFIQWYVDQHPQGAYQVRASDSISAVWGSAVMGMDIVEAFDQRREALEIEAGIVIPTGTELDAMFMPSAGGTPGVGLAVAMYLMGRTTQVVGPMADARPASLGTALNIQWVQSIATNGLGLLGSNRYQLSEVSEWALVQAAAELREAGLPVEITSAAGYAQILEIMATHPERLKEHRTRTGQPWRGMLILTGQNEDQANVDWLLRTRDVFGLHTVDDLRDRMVPGMEEAVQLLRNLRDAPMQEPGLEQREDRRKALHGSS